MAIKLAVALTFCAVVNAAFVAVAPAAVAVEEYDPHPQYKYGYDVQDNLSGDSKGHVEERDGDVVRGEYSLIDSDGFRRVVSYTADPINGFNAVLRREPLVAPVVASAPVLAAPAPLAATAPVAPAFAYSQL
ncbi:PREDICTED: larval cuticle protein A2B-like [Rhagoletis zephyria]|uniref:larval cuticle protein A2B-like n=1 Tax=Rhagoletis zephyria TaxID=28612 RepID=UPI0008115EEB|nr:PREDICTED: larval cuticle protein A2B-like [Rhagoletis zephyria]XP_036325417.1 larval cuticle protein A2B-like [Rhagoletis pomonella]